MLAKQTPSSIDPTSHEIDRIFLAQRENRLAVAMTSTSTRVSKLKSLRDAILVRESELQQAMDEDFRKNPGEVSLTEVYPVIAEINHIIAHLGDWMRPSPVSTPLALFGTTSELRYEPKGVVLILSPWNYPFNLLITPLVASIAAGNCAILKPSSKVPATSRFLKSLISKLFVENEIALFEGSAKVSDLLLEKPFDHIFFTGSPEIGKKVMTAAARHLASVTLELGGKSPAIVCETAHIKKAARRIAWGKFLNAGQTCVAPDYLLIHEKSHDAFISEIKRVIEERFGSSSEARRKSPDFCRIVSKGAASGLKEVLDASVRAGSQIAFGGGFDAEERYIEPTLLTEVTAETPIMAQEIFGPILPILRFRSVDQALQIIGSKAKPLALYLFSRDDQEIERILKRTSAGGTCVNNLMIHLTNPDLPFGGIGMSGIGNHHGHFGFKAFSHERAILKQGALFDTVKFFYPPYTPRVRKLISFATRWLA